MHLGKQSKPEDCLIAMEELSVTEWERYLGFVVSAESDFIQINKRFHGFEKSTGMMATRSAESWSKTSPSIFP